MTFHKSVLIPHALYIQAFGGYTVNQENQDKDSSVLKDGASWGPDIKNSTSDEPTRTVKNHKMPAKHRKNNSTSKRPVTMQTMKQKWIHF